MFKKELRSAYKLGRKSLTEEQIDSMSMAIANALLGLPIWDHVYYHLFLSIIEHKEVNTDFIMNILSGRDKHILIPKSDFSAIEMRHYLLTDGTRIKKNIWNIPEPVDGIEINSSLIDVVFIPLLAFDLQGNRVGYGKGFYDKFLTSCRPDTVKIGLSFFGPEMCIEDVTHRDVKLDYCVTPEQIHEF